MRIKDGIELVGGDHRHDRLAQLHPTSKHLLILGAVRPVGRIHQAAQLFDLASDRCRNRPLTMIG